MTRTSDLQSNSPSLSRHPHRSIITSRRTLGWGSAGIALLLCLSGSGASAQVVPWWNGAYSSAREVTLTAGASAIPAGTLVSLTFDHAGLVAAGSSQADGDDVRLVYVSGGTPGEISRTLASGSAWNTGTTRLTFKTQALIAAGGSDSSYFLYYGSPGAVAPASVTVPSARFFKVEQLVEQSTASASFVDVPGTTLNFTPGEASEVWVVFASGVLRSSSQNDNTSQMRLMINGVESDLWGQRNKDASTPNGSGFLIFDRITGVSTMQTVSLQFLAGGGTTFAGSLRVVAALLPQGADFQYSETDTTLQLPKNTVNASIQSLTFTPSSAGDYYVFGKMSHNDPGGGVVQSWLEDDSGGIHPNAPAGVRFSNPFNIPASMTVAFRKNLPASSRTLSLRGTVGGNNGSIWRYRKIMAFRADAWESQEYNESLGLSSTSSTTFVTKNSLTTAAPPAARDYLVVQLERVAGTSFPSLQKSGELRDGGAAILRTNHHIDQDGSAAGYHHVVGVANVKNTAAAVTYENGFLSSDAARTVECAESAIFALRYLELAGVTQRPAVRNVTSITSDTLPKGVGQVISLQVEFSEVVTVTGTPQLTLETGPTDTVLNYVGGSGTNTLNFTYTVASGHTSPDLDYTGAASLALNGGTIQDSAGFNASVTLPAPGTPGSLGANKALVVDGIPPGAPGTPSGTPNPNTGAFTVNWAAATDTGGTGAGAVTYAVERSFNGGAFGTIAPNVATTSLAESALPAGNYVYRVSATDTAGNVGPYSPNSAPVVVDTTSPTVSMTSGTTNPTNLSPIPVTVTFSEDATGFLVTDITSINGTVGNFQTLNASTYTFDLTPIAQGLVTANIAAGVAQDLAGNLNLAAPPFSRTFDSMPPAAPIISSPASGTMLNVATVTLSGTAEANSTVTVMAGVTTLGTTPADGLGNWSFMTGPLGDATYSFTATATDTAGNLGPPSGAVLVTVDTSIPSVAGVTSTTLDGSYGAGASINITVNFSEAVTLTTSNLLVTLSTGAVVSIAPFGPATSASGTYMVAAGQNSPDLTAVSPLSLSGTATLRDAGGNNCVLTIQAGQNIADSKAIVIDTTAPFVTRVTSLTGNGTYGVGAAINVTVDFSEPVTLAGGNLQVALNSGTTAVVSIAPFGPAASASGTYVVAAGQNTPDLNAFSPLTLSAGTLRDAAGNNCSLSIPMGQNIGPLKDIVIDTVAPAVTSVTSTTANGTYGVGAAINVTVNFSELVTLAGGNLQVTLDTGAVVAIAPFGPASSASGTYIVAAGQTSPGLTANSPLTLSAGTLQDAGGNSCVLTIPAGQNIPNFRAIVIDTSAPSVANVTSATLDGAYGVGASINITVNFSEPVTLAGGNFQVTLDTGAVVSIAPFGPALSASGTYLVAAGQNSPDLTASSPLTISAGTLRDSVGNDCALAIPAGMNIADLKALVIDTTAPSLASVGSTTLDGTYGVGAAINITIDFSEPVTLTGGNLLVTLDTGAVVAIAPFGPAASASGTYVVAAGQNSPDLTAISPLALPGGTLRDAAGNDCSLAILPGKNIADSKAIVIDTSAPSVTSVTSTTPDSTYGVGAAINVTVNFSEPVTLTGGTLQVALDSGGVVAIGAFGPAMSASGTYIVAAGQNSPDLTAVSPLTLSAATLRDAAGNNCVLTIPGGQNIADSKAIVIDTSAPFVTSVTSTTGDGTYGVGASINITVNFSEPVTLAGGNLLVTLDTGASVMIAPFGPAMTAAGNYVVATSQNSPDLTAISPLTLPVGTLRDAAGNNCGLTIPAGQNIANSKAIVIDTTAPFVSGVTSTTLDGTYGTGAAINITVNFSEAVTLSGASLQVTLDTGAVVLIAPFGPAVSASGIYTAAAGESSPDLTALSPLTLAAGAMLRDAAGNNCVLTIPGGQNIADTKAIVIDTSSPSVTSVTSTTGDGTYGVGAAINITVNFSEPVTLSGGNLLVTLNTGAVVSVLPFGPAATASGTYTVAAGQNTPDLTAISPLTLQAVATLRDVGGNNCVLTIPGGQNIADSKAIVIDTLAPSVASVTSMTANGSYGAGAAINVTVNFSEPVTLTGGNLQVTLNTGAVVSVLPFGPAATASGTYTVAAGQNTPDLTAISPLTLQAVATLRDVGGNNCVLTIPGGQNIADSKSIVIDTTAPLVAGVTSMTADGTYGVGASINVTVTFSELVTLSGASLLVTLDTGAVVAIAPFGPAMSASGTYVVATSQNSPDLTAVSPLTLAAGATLRDAAGNNAVLTIPGGQNIADSKAIVIDTSAPSVTSVTSTTGDGTYGVGAAINITVNFSEPVTLTGANLQVTLDTGAVVSITPFGPALSASGIYTVAAGQSSSDLTAVSPLALQAAATLRDAGGNNCVLTIPAGQNIANFKAIVIDTSAPSVTNVTSTTGDGTYGVGASIDVTVNFSEPVTLSGFGLLVTLNTGAVVSIPAFGPAATASGTYTVAAGQNTPDLTAVSPLTLASGSTLRDAAGNNCVLTIPGGQNIADSKAIVVDTAAPVVVSIVRTVGSSNPTNASNVSFTVTFSKPVTGVDSTDFALVAPGLSGTSVGTPTGLGATWTVPVATGSGDGALQLNLVDDDTIVDGSGNPLGGPGAGNGNASGQSYTIDKTPPTVVISGPNVGTTAVGPVSYTVTYTGADTVTLVAGNVTLIPTLSATGSLSVSGVGTGSRTVTISSISGTGTLAISIVAGTATDLAGNVAPGAGPSATVDVDPTSGIQVPTVLQVESLTNPTGVADGTPDFSAIHTWNGSGPLSAAKFRIQVSTDPTFATINRWNGPSAGTAFPGGVTVLSGARSPQIPYGTGGQEAGPVPLLTWNTQFHWRTQFWDTIDAASPFSTESASFRMGAPSALASANGNGSQTQIGYRFIGVPIAVNTTVPASELLDDTTTMFRWNEPTRQWLAVSAGSFLEGGRAYLLWAAPTSVVDLFSGSVALGTQSLNLSWTTLGGPAGQEITDGVGAEEYRGNHFVCNPFNRDIPWASVSKPNVSDTYYSWDGTQYVVLNSTSGLGGASPIIAPFQGINIVVLSSTPGTDIAFPDVTASSAATPVPSAPDANSWALRIEAASAGAIDTQNYVGVHPDSDDAWDRRDAEEPGPGPANWVLVSFDHRDWGDRSRQYTHDFRKSRLNVGEEVVWNMSVRANTNALVTLTWPNVASMPTLDWQYHIEDPATGISYDMISTPSMQIGPLNGRYSLVLRATRTVPTQGRLVVGPSVGGPAPTSVAPGEVGVQMLSVDLRAQAESVTVRKFVVRHEGTGDPLQVQVSVYNGQERVAGPSSFVGGAAAVWTQLDQALAENATLVWTVVYDFGPQATGTYQAVVFAEETEGTGAVSGRTIVADALAIRSAEVTLGDSTGPVGAGGGHHGRCGLLGAELLPLMLAYIVLRHGRRTRRVR